MATALTARHLGLDVLIVEKDAYFGGTTARSGGWSWIPNNPHAKRAGIADSVEAARAYLQHEAGNFLDTDKVDAFLDQGPKMVDFLENHTAVRFELGPTFSDYHPDAPGGLSAGRSIVAIPFNGRELGDKLKLLQPPLKGLTLFGMMIGTGKELWHFYNATRSVTSALSVLRLLTRFTSDKIRFGRATRLANGNALAARLVKSAFDMDIPIWLSSPATALLRDEERVIGATVQTKDGLVKVIASRGVVLASGGYSHDIKRRKDLFSHAPTGKEHWSPVLECNTGDGARLGASVGAKFDTYLSNPAAWVPVSLIPWRDGTTSVFPHFMDRAKPGFIAIAPSGKRFVNEANSYHDFCQALQTTCAETGDEVFAYLLCDHKTIRRFGMGFAKPFPFPLTSLIKSNYLIRSNTISALAREIGVDPDILAQTISRFSKFAIEGKDPDYSRGANAYNLSLGDPDHAPNPCVAPIDRGPFYAVKLVIGDLGTFAGLRTNANAQVQNEAGVAIDGLFTVGNDMMSIMGGNYPGGGITIGPALTFGYIAGQTLARHGSVASST
jgi:FAD binding domain-containing protein